MVALGRVVLSKRERVIMLHQGARACWDDAPIPYEVRDEEIYFGDIADVQIPKDMLSLAEHILETKAAKFDASQFHDRYEEAIVAMLNEKKAGMPVTKQRELPRIVAGTDLMAALRQSIERAKEAQPKPAAAADPRRRHSRQRQRSLSRPPRARRWRTATWISARCCCRSPAARPRRRPRKNSRRSPARGKRPDKAYRPRANSTVHCHARESGHPGAKLKRGSELPLARE